MKKLFTKKDFIIIFVILIIGIVGFFIINKAEKGKTVVIKSNGEIVETISLSENGYVTEISGVVVCIENEKVFVKESSCKDKVCVNSGELSKAGQSAICAPNGVSVEISGKSENLPDAITG